MKKKISLLILLLGTLVFSACQGPTDSASDSSDTSSDSSSITSSESSLETSSEEEIPTVAISSLRDLEVGQEATIRGVVVNLNYTGQSTPYVVGFWMADETGSVYIYGELTANAVSKGNTVTIRGTKGYYIPTNDASSAAAVGYLGMLQLASPTILDLDTTISLIPETAIDDITIAEINEIPLTSDITGNIYRVQGRYHRYDETSYVNYVIEDLNRVDSLLAYTQCNGKDYYWTDSYDNKTVEMLIIVSLGKPSVDMWRINPVLFINDNVVVSALQEAEYGAQRALSEVGESYDVDTEVNITISDPLLEGMTRSFASISNKIAISQVGENNVLQINAAVAGTFELSATATFGSQSATSTKTITVIESTQFETISLLEARNQTDGTVVTVEAIVARVTYKSSMVKQGLFLIDATASLFVYNGAATQANLANVENGNKVVLTGTIAHYIKSAENATLENYLGDLQLTDVTVDNLDTNVYALPNEAIIEDTIENIAVTLPSTNISSNIYHVAARVVKNASQYATSYDLVSLTDANKKLPLYSQNSGSDFAWLDEYANQEVYVYVGIQNLNLKSSNSNWRGVPISVLGPINS